MRRLAPVALALIATTSSCVGSTGSEVVDFPVFAAGPVDSVAGSPYEFDTSAGYHVRLDRAVLHIGGVYLNRSRPVQGAQDTPCVLPGVYAAELTSGMDVDVLSPALQRFPAPANGTADRALAGEVWLTGGRVDATEDSTPILQFEGAASRESLSWRFEGVITIGTNRQITPSDPATPGANPLCKSRIVTPIPIDLTPRDSGALVVRADPRVWFDLVDFDQLEGAQGQGELLVVPDELEGQPATTLFQSLRSVSAYDFVWQ